MGKLSLSTEVALAGRTIMRIGFVRVRLPSTALMRVFCRSSMHLQQFLQVPETMSGPDEGLYRRSGPMDLIVSGQEQREVIGMLPAQVYIYKRCALLQNWLTNVFKIEFSATF